MVTPARGRQARRWMRLLVAASLLVAPTLGSVMTPGVAGGAAAPAPQPLGAASSASSSSEGKCASGDTSSVTVVVDFQELGGGTVIRCGHGLQAGANGIAAMRAAGIAFDGNARYGQSFVCRILGRPSASEPLPIDGGDYREKCIDTSPAKAYWAYWQASENGSWVYSQLGIASSKARLGGFEGWSFSLNKTDSTNPPPRVDTALTAPAPPPVTTTPRPTTARPTPPRADPPRTTTPRPTTARPPAPQPTAVQPTAVQPTAVRSTAAQPTAPAVTAIDPGTAAPTTTDGGVSEDPGGPATNTRTTAASPQTTATSTGERPTSAGTGPSGSSARGPGSVSGGSPPPSTSRPAPGRTSTSDATPVPAPATDGPSTEFVTGASDAAAADPDLAAGQVEPDASSPWPVFAVLALALVAGGAAFVIARRRRGDGV